MTNKKIFFFPFALLFVIFAVSVVSAANETNCTDTDGGKNYFVKGITANSSQTRIDNCASNSSLNEYYCNGNSVQVQNLLCPDGGCSNGICGSPLIAPSNQTNQTCTNECSYSGQKACNGNYIKLCGNYDTDTCLEWNNTNQYCPNGCSNGACVVLYSTVISRHLFYKGSVYNNIAVPDKTALLPGQKATFASISSYTKGINGIYIDVINFSGTPMMSDFSFKVAANNNATSWINAPVPSSIELFTEEGVQRSDRIKITWADNAIKNTWLQVTMLANANTGLQENDVFYWGALMGDTGLGNTATIAVVSSIDYNGIYVNRKTPYPVPIDNVYDISRDKRITSIDYNSAYANRNKFLYLLDFSGGGNELSFSPLPKQSFSVSLWDSIKFLFR